jgi:hypothetical protein
MRPGDLAAVLARPTVSGTMRARQTTKDQRAVTKKQWLGYIAVAAATTWLTKTLDDFIERRFTADPGGQ